MTGMHSAEASQSRHHDASCNDWTNCEAKQAGPVKAQGELIFSVKQWRHDPKPLLFWAHSLHKMMRRRHGEDRRKHEGKRDEEARDKDGKNRRRKRETEQQKREGRAGTGRQEGKPTKAKRRRERGIN